MTFETFDQRDEETWFDQKIETFCAAMGHMYQYHQYIINGQIMYHCTESWCQLWCCHGASYHRPAKSRRRGGRGRCWDALWASTKPSSGTWWEGFERISNDTIWIMISIENHLLSPLRGFDSLVFMLKTLLVTCTSVKISLIWLMNFPLIEFYRPRKPFDWMIWLTPAFITR